MRWPELAVRDWLTASVSQARMSIAVSADARVSQCRLTGVPLSFGGQAATRRQEESPPQPFDSGPQELIWIPFLSPIIFLPGVGSLPALGM